MDKRHFFNYAVRLGDTYASLAKQFGVDEQELRNLNGKRVLRKNMLVRVPLACGCAQGAYYAIRKGESLCRIALRNGLLLEELLSANPYLNPARYIAGQVIVIPKAKRSGAQEHYIIGENEGLFDVLRKFRMDITTFCFLNPDINPMNVKPGQRVVIRPLGTLRGRWHTITQGEDLVRIAESHGINVSELLCANENLRPSDFVPGRKVRIPESNTSQPKK